MPVIINGTTGVAGVDGSASTPAVQGTDTNTGMFFPTADTIAFAEGGTEVMRIDSSGNLRVGSSSTALNSINSTNTFGFKNRIINGAMMIDQRNAGASVTGTTAYAVDRFATRIAGGGVGVLTVQRSTTVPTSQGFVNSLFLQATTADTSIGAAEAYWIQQKIEGFNTADFGFGAANASTVTLSFWVRSSVTGTYSTVLQNSAGNRSYVSEYTISAANTWEYKTITITGDTSGTWLTDNGIGVSVFFCLAVGSTYQQTANSWGTVSFATGSPNQVNFMNTLNSTFYITGVQLEKGSTATSFDYRPYGTELALCQRYYETCDKKFVVVLDSTALTRFSIQYPFSVVKRTEPTVVLTSVRQYNSGTNLTVSTTPTFTADGSFSSYGTMAASLNQSQFAVAAATFSAEL